MCERVQMLDKTAALAFQDSPLVPAWQRLFAYPSPTATCHVNLNYSTGVVL